MRTSTIRRTTVLAASAVAAVGLLTPAATAVASPAIPASYSNCGLGDFCAYSGGNGSGTLKEYYICQDATPFTSGQGSVYNNQTGGAKAYLYRYRSNGTTYLALTLSPGQGAAWSWVGSAYIRTC